MGGVGLGVSRLGVQVCGSGRCWAWGWVEVDGCRSHYSIQRPILCRYLASISVNLVSQRSSRVPQGLRDRILLER